MGPPPITITCDCGEVAYVPFGDSWQCEGCGKRWNTQQIPVEEYEGLLRRMRRFRLEVLGAAIVVAAIFVPLVVFVSQRFILLFPMLAIAWLFLYLPMWRRRARREAQGAPQWDLHAE
ncbi:MAG: hypothetical protein ACRDPV_07900 [Gaiellaceae bacterium]